jgi:hypothetical protein
MDHESLRSNILSFVRTSYPQMEVRVVPYPEDPSKTAIYFIEPKFALIYPAQRYHYLSHLIPADFKDRHLADTVWFELAPGESPEDLRYPDPDLIDEITPHVMKCVLASHAFEALDDILCPVPDCAPRQHCYGDYRHAKSILLSRGFTEDELFDVFHVLIAQGGNCDCEILFNVAETSRLAAQYWKARAEGRKPYDPHE